MKNWIYILILCSLVLLSCDTNLEHNGEPRVGIASIELDRDELFVGDRIEQINISTSGFEEASQLQLLLSNKWGIKVLEADLKNDRATFDMQDIRFEERGEVEFILTSKAEVLDRLKLNVLPLVGDSLIESYLGPKTIFVGGTEKSMLTNVTTDKFGNPIVDGSIVEYNLRHTGRRAKRNKVKTDHLVSFIQFRSNRETGKIIIGANSDQASIREQEVRVIPIHPNQVSIDVVEWFPYADNRQTVWLRSDLIKDKYGNVVADGTMISFVIEENNRIINEYKSYTIGGVANVYLENPPIETTWQVYAKLNDKTRSNRIRLFFKSNIRSIAFDYDNGSQLISVGPIKSALGQHVHDGTKVYLTVSKEKEELKLTQEALNGYCEFSLSGKDIAGGTYEIVLEVGGKTSTQRFEIR